MEDILKILQQATADLQAGKITAKEADAIYNRMNALTKLASIELRTRKMLRELGSRTSQMN